MLNGPYDFNRTPIAPLGTKCLVHNKSAIRSTWAPHAVKGWYIGPARYHYRCYTVYIPSTKGIQQSETVKFFPYLVNMPAASTADLVLETVKDLTHLLQNPVPASPFNKFGTDTSQVLAALADIFSQLKPKTPADPQSQITVPNTQGISRRNQYRAVSPEPELDDAASHPLHNRAIPACGVTPPGTRGIQRRCHISISPPPQLLLQRPRPLTPPSPRVPTVVPEDNSYTGANDRGCARETISTAHRYPTRLSQHLINNLCTPSTNQLPAQSTY